MKRATLAPLSLLAAFAFSAGSPSPATADYWTECGTRNPSIYITTKAHAVGCKIARRIGRRYALKGDRHPLGFNCSEAELVAEETFKARCKREGARIKIIYGP